jgi:heme exporter protein C
LPETSVKSAGKILSLMDGSKIKVAGFVSDYYYNHSVPLSPVRIVRFSIADFSDYQRYIDAAINGQLDTQWWTVRPIDVQVPVLPRGMGYLAVDVPSGFKEGMNLSVVAEVRSQEIDPDPILTQGFGPNANVTGYFLGAFSWDDVTIGTSPGQFGIMTAPVAQKIFYFHMPSAWVSYLAFFVTLVASALYLKTRAIKYDRWAFSSAQLGVLFATIAITTGPVWAKQEWGVYWRWDDTKLVTTFVLWLVYIGYLMLRGSMTDAGTRARVGAVYGILGFVTVPMSLLSSRIAPLLQSSHPQVIASNSGSLSPEAGMTIGIAIVAFTLLFITMLIRRVEIAESEEELEELKRTIGGED